MRLPVKTTHKSRHGAENVQYYDFHGISNAEMHRHEGEARLAMLESAAREPEGEARQSSPRWSRLRALAALRPHMGTPRTARPAAR